MNDSQITSRILDAKAYREVTPPLDFADLIDRGTKQWLVYDPGKHGRWTTCNEGDKVRVPLVPHLSESWEPATAIGFAFKLGLLLRAELAAGGIKISAAHISVGAPIEQVVDEETGMPLCFRFWLGFACQVEG